MYGFGCLRASKNIIQYCTYVQYHIPVGISEEADGTPFAYRV